MSINEEHRQVEIAAQAEELTRTLAHSTRTVPNPSDSYQLLGELGATVAHLEQVCRQLGTWHASASEAGHIHADAEVHVGQANTRLAAEALTRAAEALDTATEELRSAHSANGAIRWSS